ncbi:hypothetical protein [Thermocoleostomius sinensis]|uniref:Uncharacterized protein n=1 Tax=Thermocoleostomius sinensis A174 TaxID=2016057 RepID=A0A9E8ZNP2_9CYAN|nr:hypothetical protein [Thermocoleostomius sinensis]WAL61916.1 hypothetical protein OXH18_08010 [Thermocoleostomius sinensis A174]
MMRPTYEARLDLCCRLPHRVSVRRSDVVEMDMALLLAAVFALTYRLEPSLESFSEVTHFCSK